MSAPSRTGPALRVAIALAAAIVFGAADQRVRVLYSPFATAVSFMSAPWLLLPFVTGAFQVRSRQAAWLGLACTWVAIAAYVVMTNLTWDGGQTTLHTLAHTAYLQRYWIAGGLGTGPVYGLLGYRWRRRKSWLTAGLVAVPVLTEPVVAALGLERGSYRPASYAEATTGLVLTLVLAGAVLWSRRQREIA